MSTKVKVGIVLIVTSACACVLTALRLSATPEANPSQAKRLENRKIVSGARSGVATAAIAPGAKDRSDAVRKNGRDVSEVPVEAASETVLHETGDRPASRVPPFSAASSENVLSYMNEQEQSFYVLSSRMISDLASGATTIPVILHSAELSALPMPLRTRLVGSILEKINNGELDLEEVWPED